MAQIVLVKPLKLLGHITVSIQENVTIRGMIIAAMEIQKLLTGQIRNKLRVSAGLIGIGGIRVKGVQNLPLQYALRGGKRALHLIVDHAVQSQVAVLAVHLVMPALLAENFFFIIDIRVKYRVHVDMNQILKIFIIAAGNGVHRLIRICHGVQEGIQGALRQLHKGILYRELPGTAQYGMLQDMGHARIIRRRGTEADIKYLIFIIVG